MSLKWTNSESGILRKNEFKEKKEELFVFGYSCKIFRDDDKALEIDQGKQLIPWMGDETLKIDRYDARAALHDLSRVEAPPGGYDWRVELTRAERGVEQLCDEERYRALHTDEDEEEMYKEEELKRLHAAGYGQVGFNYETPKEPEPSKDPTEVEEPFLPTPSFRALLPPNVVLPETDKQNMIIEKTAKFIATKKDGAQMEILIKAKQADNPQFQFLNRDNELNPYYVALVALVKAEKWPEKEVEVAEEKPPPENEDYLHPSLASTVIESAPSIPSIHYKPSADCDYTMLISKMRGSPPEEPYAAQLAPGEVAPPGTEPVTLRATAEISRPPVMYHMGATVAAPAPTQPPPAAPAPPPASAGLRLMSHYNTDSDTDGSDFDDTSSTDSRKLTTLPKEVQEVIDKMALYVARNGGEFAEIVRAKRDPRFAFLEPSHEHHENYLRALRDKRQALDLENNKGKAPVSFSIKKLKEPDPILPKPALPYESSSDEEGENKTDKQTDKQEDKKEPPKPNIHTYNINIPQPVVYRMGETNKHDLPTIKAIEPMRIVPKPPPIAILQQEKPPPMTEKIPEKRAPTPEPKIDIPKENKRDETREKEIERNKENNKEREVEIKEKDRSKNIIDRDRSREKDSPNRKKKCTEKKRERSPNKHSDKEKKRDGDSERPKKNSKNSKDDLESEIISLEDNSDDMIDLTDDQPDSKAAGDSDRERSKQAERRRRAAEFLKRVGADPAAHIPHTSLASAMVDTLESMRKKKAEEEKRRKREKRRHKDKHGHTEDDKSHRKSKRRKYKSSDEHEESDYESSKKKKRKKDKKSCKSRKRMRASSVPAGDAAEAEACAGEHALPAELDLTSTLRELRTASPTAQLCLQDVEETQHSSKHQSSTDEEESATKRRKKKEDREYSEGEWSSDSEEDSVVSSRIDD